MIADFSIFFYKNSHSLFVPENRSRHFSFLFSKLEIWIPYFSFSSRFHFLASRQCLFQKHFIGKRWIQLEELWNVTFVAEIYQISATSVTFSNSTFGGFMTPTFLQAFPSSMWLLAFRDIQSIPDIYPAKSHRFECSKQTDKLKTFYSSLFDWRKHDCCYVNHNIRRS